MNHIPVDQIPMLRRLLIHPPRRRSATPRRRRAIGPLGDAQMNNPPLVTRMNELILPPPLPVRRRLVRPLPVHPADEAGQRHPEQQRNKDDGADDVVLEKFEDGGEGDVLEDVDDAHDVVGVGLLALPQVAESLHVVLVITIFEP